ncbi:MAG TPA: hypothetical protein VIX86_16950 [Streptosporangiaceae bacterium]
MVLFTLILGGFIGAVIGWRYGLARRNDAIARARAGMVREILYWKDAADRANAEAARVIREAETWAAGAQQGREDVISIMPLLMAAQEKSKGGLGTAADDSNCG